MLFDINSVKRLHTFLFISYMTKLCRVLPTKILYSLNIYIILKRNEIYKAYAIYRVLLTIVNICPTRQIQ